MEHAQIEVDAGTPTSPHREDYNVLRMLSFAFIVEIVGYTALCVGSLMFAPQEGAWTIVTNGQQGLMQLMGINLGALAGAVTQRSAGK